MKQLLLVITIACSLSANFDKNLFVASINNHDLENVKMLTSPLYMSKNVKDAYLDLAKKATQAAESALQKEQSKESTYFSRAIAKFTGAALLPISYAILKYKNPDLINSVDSSWSNVTEGIKNLGWPFSNLINNNYTWLSLSNGLLLVSWGYLMYSGLLDIDKNANRTEKLNLHNAKEIEKIIESITDGVNPA